MICSNDACPAAGQDQPAAQFPRATVGKHTCRRCIRRLEAQARAARRATGCPVDVEAGGNLPIGPLRRWLASLLDVTGRTRDDPIGYITARLGITEKTMSRWLNDKNAQWVQHDLADRCFCNWGEPTLMRELYPHTYGLPEVELRAA